MIERYRVNYTDSNLPGHLKIIHAPNLGEVLSTLNGEGPRYRTVINSEQSHFFDRRGNSVLISANSSRTVYEATLESPSKEGLERLAESLGLPFESSKVFEPKLRPA